MGSPGSWYTEETMQFHANQSIQDRGYWIICYCRPLHRGEVVTDIQKLNGHQVVVVGEATPEEFLEQNDRVYRVAGAVVDLTNVTYHFKLYPYCYKVTAE